MSKIATDPPVSEKQRRAMEAAAHGHSTLGIPKSVGQEFVGKDGAPQAAGIVFVAKDGDVLLLRRAKDEKNYGGHWGLPGGGGDAGETPLATALREFKEECGLDADPATPIKLLNRTETPNGWTFSTFAKPTEDKFVPTLDGEHSGYCWASLDQLPRPLHPQVEKVLGEHLGAAADMSAEQWEELRTNFAQWTREEEAEGEHANDQLTKLTRPNERPGLPYVRKQAGLDAALAMDRNIYDAAGHRIVRENHLAFDKGTVRSYDRDGRLRVSKTPISKANICEYYGHEIPGGDVLGLDPNRKYKLLRHPDELRKAAKSSNGVPLLITHVPVDADDHQPDMVVGALGTDGDFDGTFLTNSLIVWAREGIDAIESGDQRELSMGYHYRADMTPGIFMGNPYDGVMRDLEVNHEALVPAGRAGADVLVADSAIQPSETEKILMTNKVLTRFGAAAAGALAVYLKPKMATDAQPVDMSAILAGITAANFKARKPQLAADIKAKVKLAKDANLDDVVSLLDKLEDCRIEEGADADPNSGLPMSAEEMAKKAKDEATEEEKKKKEAEDKAAADRHAKDKAARDNFRAGLDSEEKREAFDALFGEKAEEKKDGKDAEPEPEKEKKAVDKKAMDAAIKAASDDTAARVRREMNATAEAYQTVEPWVGKLALGMDSAEVVYRTALKGLGVDGVDGLHADALKPILMAQPKPGDRQRLAQDALPAGDAGGFNSRWGDTTNRVGVA